MTSYSVKDGIDFLKHNKDVESTRVSVYKYALSVIKQFKHAFYNQEPYASNSQLQAKINSWSRFFDTSIKEDRDLLKTSKVLRVRLAQIRGASTSLDTREQKLQVSRNQCQALWDMASDFKGSHLYCYDDLEYSIDLSTPEDLDSALILGITFGWIASHKRGLPLDSKDFLLITSRYHDFNSYVEDFPESQAYEILLYDLNEEIDFDSGDWWYEGYIYKMIVDVTKGKYYLSSVIPKSRFDDYAPMEHELVREDDVKSSPSWDDDEIEIG